MSNSLTLTRRNCGQYIEKNMELPQNCRSISAETFFNRPDIRSVVIPPNVKYLGKWIFHGCNRLQYLEIRHDPEFIGEWIINKAATIRCYKGSKVDRYCQQSGFKVEYFS